WPYFAAAGALLLLTALAGAGAFLAVRRGRARVGTWLAFGAFVAGALLLGGLLSGLGLVLGLPLMLVGIVVFAQALPRPQLLLSAVIGLVAGLIVWLVDSLAGAALSYRALPLGFVVVAPLVALALLIAQGLFMGQGLADLSLRAK